MKTVKRTSPEFLLREIAEQDLKTINKWRADRTVVDFLGANFLHIAEKVDRKWYDAYLSSRDRNVRLAIVVGKSKKLIGMVALTSIQPINRSAEFSIVIGEREYWSKGYGKLVTQQMLAHAFQDLNLNRVFLYVLSDNTRAIKLYQAAGFKIEGTLREAVFKNKAYRDMILMAALKSHSQKSVRRSR